MQKIHLYDKIISPLLTEKSTNLSDQNKIIFKIPNKTNKINLKKNIEKIFKTFNLFLRNFEYLLSSYPPTYTLVSWASIGIPSSTIMLGVV